MQPLFTVHAGEFLVAGHLERAYRNTRIWIPTKDTGIDLLVTDKASRRTVSLQVKYSRDYLVTHLPSPALQAGLSACGWWVFDPAKLASSPADYWVLLLVGFNNRTKDCIVIKPTDLLRRLRAIHGREKRLQSYFWITKADKVWETRRLVKPDQLRVAAGTYQDRARNFSRYLNDWSCVESLNRAKPS